jgi:hypothetical protein
MTELERKILDSLTELDGAVKSLRTANPKPALQPILARLDELTRELPEDSPPRLLHYLRKKSYEKARFFLAGREADNARGACLGD